MAEPNSQSPQPIAYLSPLKRQRNLLAIYSVIVGVVGVVVPVLGGLIGLLMAREALRRTRSGTVGGRPIAIAGIIVGAISMLISDAVAISIPYAREQANRAMCAQTLSAIGQAILLYENDNHGQRPLDLGTLCEDEGITGRVFLCPSGSGNPATAPTNTANGALRNWVNQCTDYIYLGAGKPDSHSPAEILIYEKPDNHGSGMNILFADGRVYWLSLSVAKAKIKAQTGHDP